MIDNINLENIINSDSDFIEATLAEVGVLDELRVTESISYKPIFNYYVLDDETEKYYDLITEVHNVLESLGYEPEFPGKDKSGINIVTSPTHSWDTYTDSMM